jgi:hypothetical protein
MFDCRRYQAPDAPSALEAALATAGAAGPAAVDPNLSEWCGVEVGVHCPVMVCELQHARRIVQSTGTDYIFGEHTQLLGGGPDPGSTAPEVYRHARPSAPVPSGGHAVTLRDMLVKNDVFALGYTMYNMLLAPEDMARFPDVSGSSLPPGSTVRDWDLPELPGTVSRPLKAFLQRLVAWDPARRPTLRLVLPGGVWAEAAQGAPLSTCPPASPLRPPSSSHPLPLLVTRCSQFAVAALLTWSSLPLCGFTLQPGRH